MNPQTITPNRNQQTASPKPTSSPKNAPSPAGSDKSDRPSRKEVRFELEASSAKEVLLAGDFTGWDKTPIKLRKGKEGTWRADVTLAPGQYHYKFVVDGEWKDDPSATRRCPNPFGTCDSVLEIS